MIQKLKNIIMTSVMTLLIAAPAVLAVPVAVGTASAACPGSGIAGNVATGANDAANSTSNTGCNSDLSSLGNNGGTLSTLAKNVVNIFSIIIGVVSVIMILYGGFRYITSGGASDKVGNAKNTIIYAIIGLIIVAIAQVIVHFVLSSANNATSGF